MLQIKSISKQYKTGDLVQTALDQVSLSFRDNEFVSILGPSGSGKTTLLNIIGGLDRYDSGDLIINHVSTKKYKDRDWDSYRNHTIGFVFQSYNLIPHQSVLANVELALTIGGISRKERKKRALEALEQVGLKEQAHKKPNQMSGGQMQRVAIARALVNNPDILLADEPTGALDTETSLQVMELLKKVADDRLVIMVTHNPELAENYSTRIVRLQDGKVTDDSDPFVPDSAKEEPVKHKNLGKASMSLLTAFSLSFKNLLTKKARTILTAFAGSIGIIGIALILSLSTGFQKYIDKIQEDTLTSYPLTISAETADPMAALLSMSAQDNGNNGSGMVEEQQFIQEMLSTIASNDMVFFKQYLADHADEIDDMVSVLSYSYDVQPMVYTTDVTGKVSQLNPSQMFEKLGMGSSMMMSSSSTSIFNEIIDNQEFLEEQYDVLKGNWPKNYDEVVLILPGPNSISDMLLYGLGLRDSAEFQKIIAELMEGGVLETTTEPLTYSYDELMQIPLKLLNATETYRYNEQYQVYENMTTDATYMQGLYDDAIELKIVGIVCPKSGQMNMMSGVGYTKALTQYVIDTAAESEIVQKQLANPEIDVFRNKRFDDESEDLGINFEDMITVDQDMLANAFGGSVSQDDIAAMTQGYMGEISASLTADTTKAEAAYKAALTSFATGMLNQHIAANKSAALNDAAMISMSDVNSMVNNYMALNATKAVLAQLEAEYLIPQATLSSVYAETLKGMVQGYITAFSNSAGLPGIVAGENAVIASDAVAPFVATFVSSEPIDTAAKTMAINMTQAVMQRDVLSKVGELIEQLTGTMADAFQVDEAQIAGAFQFNMDEEELTRLMQTLTASAIEKNAKLNLVSLGYQDVNDPSMISFYFSNFALKEKFMAYLEEYNTRMAAEDEDKVIQYIDLTGVLMSSVQTIVSSVGYVLIAFVSISLIVSSIMIGIITYISVLERRKEIGVLRAIGASKRNISSIFNAETFIVGLFSGILGIAVTLSLLIPINYVIHSLTGNSDITAILPINAAIILVVLSVVLTLISGLIPSRQAAKKDPVLALRSE